MAIKEIIASEEAQPTRLKMSYEEFLEWSNEDTHAEWDASTGEVIIFMPPKDIHQTTLSFLYELLSLFVRLFNLGKVGFAPFEVKLKPDGSSREPDIFFVAKPNLERWTEDKLFGPADLIIEIVSTSTVQNDRRDKFREYAEAGVQEYWIIDPRPGKQRADFFRLDEQGQYYLFATEDNQQVKSQVLPNFWLRPAWLWQVDTLNPLTCALEIEGVAAALTQQIQQVQSKGDE
ncbi:MAG: Uma2 family endonuclease [Anaerolineae bacterium]|nr:Uma2 family endonuclease [Anaerolineae bacterium]